MAARLIIKAIAEKTNHHSGYCHHLIEDEGENCVMMLANTMEGKAISIARIARNWSIFSGIMCRLIIQNPSTPIARRAATDCKVTLKTCILNRFLAQENGGSALLDPPYKVSKGLKGILFIGQS